MSQDVERERLRRRLGERVARLSEQVWVDENAATMDNLSDEELDLTYEGLVRLSETLGAARTDGISDARVRQLKRVTYTDLLAAGIDKKGKGKAPPIANGRHVRQVKGKGSESSNAVKEAAVSDETIKDERCGICLEDYSSDDVLIELECKHALHEKCLEMWLKDKSTCPLCRAKVDGFP